MAPTCSQRLGCAALLLALLAAGVQSFVSSTARLQTGRQSQQAVSRTQQQRHTIYAAADGGKDVDDLLESPAFLTKKVEVLKKQLAKTEEEIAAANAEADKEWEEWGPQIQRLETEFTFLKQRMLNDTMEAGNEAKVKALKAILTVNDNFERASQAIKAQTDGEKAVVAYYKGVYNAMHTVFKELGMEPVPTVGHPFDYNLHEAVMRQPSAEHEEDLVSQEFTKGFTVGGTLIRPAMVAVSSG
ncbi:heat shock protein GrpE [Tribonema minus]|uniref:GrpE protein homolog n=1 Tax=Tribonema minus TaxID=303371 RepID=A0A835ZCF7_9STRA|nr:heat shock protein GrpE [Tribonema minus]